MNEVLSTHCQRELISSSVGLQSKQRLFNHKAGCLYCSPDYLEDLILVGLSCTISEYYILRKGPLRWHRCAQNILISSDYMMCVKWEKALWVVPVPTLFSRQSLFTADTWMSLAILSFSDGNHLFFYHPLSIGNLTHLGGRNSSYDSSPSSRWGRERSLQGTLGPTDLMLLHGTLTSSACSWSKLIWTPTSAHAYFVKWYTVESGGVRMERGLEPPETAASLCWWSFGLVLVWKELGVFSFIMMSVLCPFFPPFARH